MNNKLVDENILEYYSRLFHTKIKNLLNKHANDNVTHVTEEERQRWNRGVVDGDVSKEELEAVKTELKNEIQNPVGETSTYNSVKAVNDIHIGKRGPVGPPNFNNAYCSGALYMCPKEESPVVTGPGAAGGNIYLSTGKAICGFTKAGPLTNPDGTSDSGIRTIGFVGQVMQEDKDNNEDSVYIGTNVSRLYLYSRTAYPMIVTKKEVLLNGIEGQDDINTEVETQAQVETISPVASQEWVQMLLESLGMIGGKEDTTNYIAANKNPNISFNLLESDGWTTLSSKWSLSSDGTIGHSKGTGRSVYVPLFQDDGWNDLYFLTNSNSWNATSFLLMRTPKYAYGVTLETDTYKLFAIDTAGKRYYDYQSPLKPSLEEAKNNNYVVRLKYDSTNQNFIFSYINESNEETIVLSISKFSFNGFNEFSDAQPVLGLCCNLSATNSNLIKVVDRPEGFIPVQRADLINEYAVVRQKDLNDFLIAVDAKMASYRREIESMVIARTNNL